MENEENNALAVLILRLIRMASAGEGLQRISAAVKMFSMRWAAIFHKRHVRLAADLSHLHFFNSEQDRHERIPPFYKRCTSFTIGRPGGPGVQ